MDRLTDEAFADSILDEVIRKSETQEREEMLTEIEAQPREQDQISSRRHLTHRTPTRNFTFRAVNPMEIATPTEPLTTATSNNSGSADQHSMPMVESLKSAQHRDPTTPASNHTIAPMNTFKISGSPTQKFHQPIRELARCLICLDQLSGAAVYVSTCGCFHCIGCINDAFRIALSGRQSFPPRCCGREIELMQARTLLRADLITLYQEKEAEYRAEKPMYCSNKQCNKFLLEPYERAFKVENLTKFVICKDCKAVTCTDCKDSRIFHRDGVQCIETLASNGLQEMSQDKRWSRCPSCQHLVEKSEGCNHMRCICGQNFCHTCSKAFQQDPVNKYLKSPSCSCPQFDAAELRRHG